MQHFECLIHALFDYTCRFERPELYETIPWIFSTMKMRCLGKQWMGLCAKIPVVEWAVMRVTGIPHLAMRAKY